MPIVTIGGLPVYQACVTDEDTGMFRISLVDDPAVQSNFQAFDAQRRIRMYAISDEAQRLVLGVVMRADFPIYRRDENGEYYIIYKPEEIRKMAEKYLLEGRQNAVNLMHKAGTDTDGVQMVQYFIKGKGLAPEGFDEISDGSLFAEFHIVNDEIWDAVKAGTYKGFSLEGVFEMVPEQDKARVEEIVDELDGKFSNQPNTLMSKLQKIRAGLARLLAQFGNVTTDKGVLAWDGDEDLKAGDRVYIEDQDGNRTDPEDGDYRTEDGKTIVVENNQVAEIRDPEAEVAPQGEDGDDTREDDVNARRASRFSRLRQLFEETYEDKIRKIWAAIAERYEDGYVVESADGYAVAEIWDENYNSKYIRFALTWDEDGNVTLGDEQEVKLMFVPLDFVSPFESGAAAGDTEAEELRRQNAELRAQLDELRKRPAAKPAHEEVKASATFTKTGNKGLDRIAALMKK